MGAPKWIADFEADLRCEELELIREEKAFDDALNAVEKRKSRVVRMREVLSDHIPSQPGEKPRLGYGRKAVAIIVGENPGLSKKELQPIIIERTGYDLETPLSIRLANDLKKMVKLGTINEMDGKYYPQPDIQTGYLDMD